MDPVTVAGTRFGHAQMRYWGMINDVYVGTRSGESIYVVLRHFAPDRDRAIEVLLEPILSTISS